MEIWVWSHKKKEKKKKREMTSRYTGFSYYLRRKEEYGMVTYILTSLMYHVDLYDGDN